jgi:hypothetical protein
MPKTARGERFGSALPAESYAAAEFPIPQPPPVAGKAGNRRPVGQGDRVAGRVLVNQARDKRVRVCGDPLQFLLRSGLPPYVIRRPASPEGLDIAGQILP